MKATLDCILDIGVRETTSSIARRAGISRGALMHHYPTKEALMHAALEDLLEQVATVGQLATDISAGTMDFDTFLATLCDHFTGDLFMARWNICRPHTESSIKNVLLPWLTVSMNRWNRYGIN
ncbi:MAG: TetR/AcrR family transcriptional regulator [Gammaproteobacteria bacterium]